MKLKKLVISGFKSFADRTEFEFDDGISCVVGPNGCGKSNVVDAVKWVLGEQSAKSLRGSEMMDVIFNGSSSRRPAGCAEVTLVFDNSSGLLRIGGDTPVSADGLVALTRRLFRSGQSEYLINKTPSRLRDIREMLMDTGVGVDAYSVIEQGRVEGFLQASQEDRRAIFDEAAGISKYKARKKETLRKLERVEQNLQSLSLVVGEVEKRLRSIKYQAGKARNYQEYSQQLKDLRALFVQAQFHGMKGQRTALQGKLDAASDALAAVSSLIGQLESARSAAEGEATDLDRTARELGARLADLNGQITTRRERADMLASRVAELGQQIVAACSRCEELEAKAQTVDGEIAARSEELHRLTAQVEEHAVQCQAAREAHAAGELAVTQLQDRLEDEKAGTIDLLRRTAQLHNEIQNHGVRRDSLHGQQNRLSERAAEIVKNLEAMLTERATVQNKLNDVQEVLKASQSRLDEVRQAGKELSDHEHEARGQLAGAREEQSALVARIDTLTEMQKRREGVADGVKRVLEAQQAGKLPAIRGMLGDFLQSDVQHAPIIEAALAGADQHLLADSLDQLAAAGGQLQEILSGRGAVDVLCLDRLSTLSHDFDPAACPGILGRAIDWVRFEPWLAPLMWRMLGKTFIVQSLADAALASVAAPAGSRFVTQGGEVLEPDGRVRVGAASRAAGVIWRRSELSELEAKKVQLDQDIQEFQSRCQTMKTEREHLEELQHKLRTAIYEGSMVRVEAEGRLGRVNEQIARLQREQPVVAADIEHIAQQVETTVRLEHEARQKAEELERISAERQAEMERLNEEIAAARSRQAELAARLTELKVAVAQLEEKKLSLRDSLNSLGRQKQQMEQDLAAGRSQIDLNRQRKADTEGAIATARAEVERLAEQKQSVEAEAADVEESQKGIQEKLGQVRDQLACQRKTQEESSAGVNSIRLELGEADVRIENLIGRANEELGMNLLEAFASYQHDEARDWAAVENEIKDLKGKIERLGNVNLDAIAEHDELGKRQEFLAAQVTDINNSRQQLTDLIRRINKESRDMFVATFDVIRANFQELFRKLFGGGKADVFLLDNEDVLESGIEVVARPPGKELRSISLLSGGEKTMTALALLFSIFRSRPSPFCVLDEVDAALDEANNRRFNQLVAEFMQTSQFLIITHAKRTMSMANVLYGVTMQEPGVSKRISVRFEDSGKKLDEKLAPVPAPAPANA